MSRKGVKLSGLTLFLFSLFLVSLGGLTGCTSRSETAAAVAATRGWTARVIPTRDFDIMTWAPARFAVGQPLVVYIESDGLAFLSATQISDDPTPTKPLALRMAALDPRPNVVYIARPCQFTTGTQRRNCTHAFWTYARYGQPVVDSLNAVVDRFKSQSGATDLRLYGYSGGGAIAALLAARRGDVRHLTTVAGVLDHQTWTRLDDLTPLVLSLNPADDHRALEDIAQIHFSGARDDVVPGAVARAYQARFPAGKIPPVVVVPGADHECCWVDLWPTLLKTEE